MYSKVLVLLDGSEAAEAVLEYAPSFLLAGGTREVTLLTVLDRPATPSSRQDARLEQRAAELRRALDPEERGVPEVRVAVLPGGEADVAGTIIGFGAGSGTGAIMLATRGWSGVDWWSTGTVAERVIKGATVPVFVVRPTIGRRRRPVAVKRVLVPLDGSPLAEQALPYAAHLARNGPATLDLLHVKPPGGRRPAPDRAEPEVADQNMARYLDETAAQLDLAEGRVVTSVRHGATGQQITEAAEEAAADLIVIASHGRTGPGRGALGGVADRVLHGSHIPVLVVPATPERTAG